MDRGLPITWSKTHNIAWFAPTKGLGWSSPVVYRRKIYITTAVAMDKKDPSVLDGAQSLRLVCYWENDGALVFEKELLQQTATAPDIHSKNSHASPTVVAHDERLYVHFGHQGTVCTDLDGNIQWTNRDHPYPPTHGNGGSPIWVDGKLILTCDGGEQPITLALDCETGKEVWSTGRGVETDRKFSFCTPQAIVVNGTPQIISPGSNVVQALSPADGSVLWSVRYDGYSVIPRPLYYQGLVFVCTGYNTAKLLAIDPTGRGDVTDTHVRWTYGTSVPQTPSLIGFEDCVIMASDNGVATAVNIATGKDKWKKRLGGNYSASPLLAGNHIYFQSEGGEAIVFELKDRPVELARNVLPGRIFASYAVADGDFIIRAEHGLYRISNK